MMGHIWRECMKVETWDDYLMIIPETDFEEKYLDKFKGPLKAFLKCGSTPAHIVGIKIEKIGECE